MSARTTVASIKSQLADLGMPGSLEVVDSLFEKLDAGILSLAGAIDQLLAAMRSSRLPSIKRLDSFDFTFQPSIDRNQVLSLHELTFIERKENVILLGPAGVGKTHIAISLAVSAAERGRRIYFSTLSDMVLSLVEAEKQGRLKERLTVLRNPSLLIVDEIGYLPLTAGGTNIFFQLVNARYEKGIYGPDVEQEFQGLERDLRGFSSSLSDAGPSAAPLSHRQYQGQLILSPGVSRTLSAAGDCGGAEERETKEDLSGHLAFTGFGKPGVTKPPQKA